MRQMMAETIVKIGAIAASFCEEDPDSVCIDFENKQLFNNFVSILFSFNFSATDARGRNL